MKGRCLIRIFLILISAALNLSRTLKGEVEMSDEEKNEDQDAPQRPESDPDLSDPRKIEVKRPTVS